MTGTVQLREEGGKLRGVVMIGGRELWRNRTAEGNAFLDVAACKLNAIIDSTVAEMPEGRRTLPYLGALLNSYEFTVGRTRLTIYTTF